MGYAEGNNNKRPLGHDGHRGQSYNYKRPRNSDHVRNHYNSRPEMGRTGREQSPIIALRDFNNWVKSAIISIYVREQDNCFDMCCGKGGDLLKWAYVNAGFLFACDIADQSIADAKQRSLNMRNRPFRAQFECVDISKVRLADKILPRAQETNEVIVFDCVSCQFGLHYGFETNETCNMFFQNASDRLRKGGHFFGSIPNAVHLVKKLRERQKDEPNALSYGSPLFKVDFKDHPKSDGEFGNAYDFSLTSAVDSCTEYLVHPAVLRAMGERYGLELVLYEGFHEFFENEMANPNGHSSKLLDRMVYRSRSSIPEDQWEIAGYYCVFCFRKATDKLYTPETGEAPAAPTADEAAAENPALAVNDNVPDTDDAEEAQPW